MTGKKVASALTQQEKATATLALITERAGVAVGDLGRTMNSPANTARRLAAQVLTVRDSIAHALLPAMAVVLGELSALGGNAGFTGLATKIQESSTAIAAWAQFAVETFKTVAMAIAAPVRIAFNLGEVLGKLLVSQVQLMTGNFEGARETLSSMIGDFGDMKAAVTNVITGFDNMRIASGAAFQAVAEELAPAIAGEVTPALNIANAAFREMSVTLPAISSDVHLFASANNVLAVATNAAASAQDRLNSALGKAGGFLGALGSLGGVLGLAIPGIGQAGGLLSAFQGFSGLFQHGGTIPSGGWGIVGERGPEIVQGPAQVTPTGGSGVSISFSFPPAKSPSDAARDPEIARMFAEQVRNALENGMAFA
jgi:6-pyruvoyl-tetrahydropterin synthase